MATNNIFKTSGISARERKLLTINDFGGVDYMANPLAVANNRAVEIKNFIKRDGVNQKRYGWTQISKLTDSEGNPLIIRNIWHFVASYDDNLHPFETFIAYTSNGKFWTPENNSLSVDIAKFEQINWVELHIWNGTGENVDLKLPDKELYAFPSDNKLFILTGVKYLIAYLSPESNTLRITLAEDPYEIKTYIPTVLTGVPRTPTPLDDFNLLNSKIKVKGIFYSEKDVETEVASELCNEYELSVSPNFSKNIRFPPSVEEANSAYETLMEEINHFKSKLPPFIELKKGENVVKLTNVAVRQNLRADDQKLRPSSSPIISYDSLESFEETYWNYVGAGGENYRELVVGYQDDSGEYFLYNDSIANKAILQVLNNLYGYEFEIIYEIKRNNTDVINKCTFGCLYGNSNNNTLFISGNPQQKNVDYHSSGGLGDFTYFSDLDYCAYGTPLTAVKGYSILSDGSLCILKEESYQEPTIYFRTSTFMNATAYDGTVAVDSNGNVLQEEHFPLTTGNISEGLINTNSFKTFVQDTVFLSKNGLFGITTGTNVNSNVKVTRERSRFVNPRLTQHNLSDASIIVFDNKYLISVKDDEGTVFIADARYKTELTDDLYSWQYEWWVWKNVHAENFITIDNKLYFSKSDGTLNVFSDNNYWDTQIQSNCSVAFDFNSEQPIHLSDKLVSTANYIYIDNATLKINEEDLPKLLPIKIVSENEFQIIDGEGEPIRFTSANFTDDAIVCKFISTIPVECIFQTVPFSFGTTIHSKYLHHYALTNNTIEGSKYNLGIRTSDVLFNPFEEINDNKSSINFNSFSFSKVAFRKEDFAKSFNFKFRIPKINFVQFLFWNNGEENCSVSSLQLIYSIGLMQKGVK